MVRLLMLLNLIPAKYAFYDIAPEHPAIEQLNFLNFDESILDGKYKTHIIGNPPFGRQSSMAIQFIKKCCSFADSISFILPKSFKKESMRKNSMKIII